MKVGTGAPFEDKIHLNVHTFWQFMKERWLVIVRAKKNSNNNILIDANRIHWCTVEEINFREEGHIFSRKGQEGGRESLMNSNASTIRRGESRGYSYLLFYVFLHKIDIIFWKQAEGSKIWPKKKY